MAGFQMNCDVLKPVNQTYGGAPTQGMHYPTVTGTSVIGMKFDGGVIIAADTLGSYGSMSKYRNVQRLAKVNEKAVMGVTGDLADFQYLNNEIKQYILDDQCMGAGEVWTANSLHCWITQVLYHRRSKMDPLWNTIVVGGMNTENKPFLGYVDKLGMAYQSDTIASGFGNHIAIPMLRDFVEKANNKPISLESAKEMIKTCQTVLYYRDCRSFDKYDIAIVTKDGAVIESDNTIQANWEVAHTVSGYQ